MKKVKQKTYKVTLEFDNFDAAHGFVAHWLDGGGDGGGNLDWNTDYKESSRWDKGDYSKLRIKGTGLPLDENGEPIDE